MASYTYPGIYIEELPANGPIAGVGTSTAAFIGPALQGPVLTPTKVTNWTQFRNTFGDYMIGPPRYYMAYAVKGFFDNGGTVAYIVRAGTAQRAFVELSDRKGIQPGPGHALRVQAKQEGPVNIKVVIADELSAVHRQQAAIKSTADNVLTLTTAKDAAGFKAGDTVTIDGHLTAIVNEVNDANLILSNSLGTPVAQAVVRIADLLPKQTKFRLDSTVGVERGSTITITQQSGTATPVTTEQHVIDKVLGDFITLAGTGLANTYSLASDSQSVAVASPNLFSLSVIAAPNPREDFPGISMDPRQTRYWGSVVNSSYVDVMLPSVQSTQPPPDNRPAVTDTGGVALDHQVIDDPSTVGLYEQAIQALVPIRDVQLICMPDRTDQAAQQELVAHCETMGDRFAILDAAPGLKPDSSQGSPLLTQRGWCESERGYASFYYPWIQISDPSSIAGNNTLLIPPSGHIAGIYARVDAQRGVHKAPANELIIGALGLEAIVDNTTQGEFNLAGIDVLRIFPGEVRPVVWGARTTAPPAKTAWMHNSVRRLFIFVETSLQSGLRQWVFEPNDTTLWRKLERTITEFLTRVWRSGALAGNKPSEAFYVKIDELNPSAVSQLGQVIIEIGMAPAHPAEFVIVRIGIWEGGSSVTET